MSKNNNVIQLFFYSVICLSIGFLIYNSCKNKIVEGFDSKEKTEQDDAPQGKEFLDFSVAVNQAARGPSANSDGYFSWNNQATKGFSASPLITSLPWIKNNMDISGNLNSTLIFIQDQRELLRLMGVNEMASNWANVSPVFMQFYKDKMFFLNDLEKYIKQFCIKTGAQCSGSTSGGGGGGGNWWNNLTGGSGGSGGSGGDGGGDDWWNNLSDEAQKDWQGAQDSFNNMDKNN